MSQPSELPPRSSRPGARPLSFLIIGSLGAGLNFVIYASLVQLGVPYLLASWIGWISALAVVFFLNRRFTFQAEQGLLLSQAAKTLAVYLLQQAVFSGLLTVFVEWAGLSKIVAYFAALPIAVALSYFGMRNFVFHRSTAAHKQSDT